MESQFGLFSAEPQLVDFAAEPKICAEAGEAARSSKMRGIVSLQILLHAMTVFGLFWFLRSSHIRKYFRLFSPDLRVVVLTGTVFYVLPSFCLLIFYAYKFILMYMQMPNCWFVWEGRPCTAVYLCTVSLALLGNSCFHLALLVERLITTFRKDRADESAGFVGAVLSTVMLTLPVGTLIWGQFHEQGDTYTRDQAFCASSISVMNADVVIGVFYLALVDAMISAGDFLLWIYNRRQICRRIADYSLKRRFAVREMQISIRLIFPFSIAHAITHFVQLLSFFLYIQDHAELEVETPLNGLALPAEHGTHMEAYCFETLNTIRAAAILLLVVFLIALNDPKLRRAAADEWTDTLKVEADLHFYQFNQMIAKGKTGRK